MKSSGPTPHEGESRCSYLSTTAPECTFEEISQLLWFVLPRGLMDSQRASFWMMLKWLTHTPHKWVLWASMGPVQSATVEIHSVQTSAPSHQPSLRCRFIPSYILFTTVYVAAWGFLSISECPELQMQEQHAIPSTRCIFQDWKSKATILCHLHDCGLESAEHS